IGRPRHRLRHCRQRRCRSRQSRGGSQTGRQACERARAKSRLTVGEAPLMSIDPNKALLAIQQQLKELDVIYRDTMEGSLNTVSGTERVAKWRVRTIALLTESVGEKEAQEFARLQPGMV